MEDAAGGRRKPCEVLLSVAERHGVDILSKEFAEILDEIDPLKEFRKKFAYPKKSTLKGTGGSWPDPSEECVYLCGNSLGLKPIKVDLNVQAQLDKWAQTGVELHFEGPLPAALCDRYQRDVLGNLVGAEASCVVLMNGLTVNLHLLLLSFYRPTQERFKILIEEGAFPSDRYAVVSQAELRGFDPKEAVLEVGPREGEFAIRTEDVLQVIEEVGDAIAVVCLSGVQFYTGQKFDMGAITAAGHRKGCFVGWDLAHAVGNVELRLDEWKVDFACWCTYKYMNCGAGCIAGAYVNACHRNRSAPHLKGWWSNKEETRFEMRRLCDTAVGVDAFRLCNPPPFLATIVMASLEIFAEAGLDRLLKKQFLLTGYLEVLLKEYFQQSHQGGPSAVIITPESPEERGCQLSLIFSCPLQAVHEELQKRGIVCDVRPPQAMRVAPVPLYNSYTDVYKFVHSLRDVFALLNVDE